MSEGSWRRQREGRRSRRKAGHSDSSMLVGNRWFTPYLLSTPALVMISAILAFPVVYAIWGSLFDTQFLGGPQEYVGLKHYQDLFADPSFRWAISRTAIFVTGGLIIGIGLSLVFAFALNRATRRLRFLRGLTIVPYLVSGVAAAVMFRLLFNGEFGMVNRMLGIFGIEGPTWFSNPDLAMLAAIITQIWTDLPLAVLLLLGGLQTINPSLLDAAVVDGASGWKRARYISIPLITPQLVIATVWFSYATLTSLGVVLALTGGGPMNATRTLPVALYETAFKELQQNEALAIVIVILAINALLTLFYASLNRKFDLDAT